MPDNEKFQSTSPAWGMTFLIPYLKTKLDISIHIPRVGDDGGFFGAYKGALDFNPHPPRGG